ncbi:putative short-chain dehydrogenase/reductase SDR, NAD(P)-binding domain superfamily [Septoria linicola]|nr:putative short-chain dehydrogenase/reductase SDR, NAD(P)-binding domain superfamily [Septoria linicola]
MTTRTRSILITGCSEGGIGAAVALQYQKRGYHVFASARDTTKLPTLLTSLPQVTPIVLDVTSEDSIRSAVETVSKATSGTLDILFNNAGTSLTCPALDTPISDARRQFEVHAIAPLAMAQAFFPLLMNGESPVILNNSSIAGETNLPFQAAYGASKAAVANLGETMRLELEPLGVRVITVVTGTIETKLHENEKLAELPESSYYLPLGHWLKERKAGTNRPKGMAVEDYARLLVDKVEKGQSGKIFVGPLTPLFVWLEWWMPTWIWDKFMLMSGPPSQNELIREELARKKQS